MSGPTIARETDETLDLLGSSTDLDRLRVVLPRLLRRIRATSSETITPSQRSVLGTVHRDGPLTIGQVAELERMQPPSASKVLSSLEQAGLIERRSDPGDRRCSRVVISDAGSELIDELGAASRGWLAQQLAMLDDVDVKRIAAAVPALERLLGASPSAAATNSLP